MKNKRITVSPKTRRQIRGRAKIAGTAVRPRVSVFRSNAHFYVQLIDDTGGKTLGMVSDALLPTKKSGHVTIAMARAMGGLLSKKAAELGIKAVVFDRSGYKYHGRIQALAEGAREGGLVF